MFLKIEGIDGESLDRWHKNEIEIDNWSWTTKNNVTWGKNQGGHSTNAEISQITVNKICCRASAILYRYCVTGKHFKKARIICRKNDGEKKLEYLTVELEDVMISQVKWFGNGANQTLQETIEISFAEFYLVYKIQQDTGDAGKEQTFGFNVQTQVQRA